MVRFATVLSAWAGQAKASRVLFALALAAALGTGVLAGCSSDQGSSANSGSQDSSQQAPAEGTVTVTVGNTVTDETLASGEVELPEGATALDALQALDVEVTVEDSAYGAYVSAINGVASEGMSGWTFAINGEMPSVSAGEAEVQPGDVVEWTYIDMSE